MEDHENVFHLLAQQRDLVFERHLIVAITKAVVIAVPVAVGAGPAAFVGEGVRSHGHDAKSGGGRFSKHFTTHASNLPNSQDFRRRPKTWIA